MEEEKEDRLSDLPDCLIHHVLSFLPATRDAIRTGVLSRRWRNQWRQVPVLSFCFENFEDIDNVLNQHECSKIEKFDIIADNSKLRGYPHLDHKIRFAISRDVKDLILNFFVHNLGIRLPNLLFSHTLVVKLKIKGCVLLPNEKVNWNHLKEFSALDCEFSDRAIENILSGSPLLESLNLVNANFHHLVIASKSLRKLAMGKIDAADIEISCPNLEELCVKGKKWNNFKCYYYKLDNKINNILCDKVQFTKDEFIIPSESLKKLVLEDLDISYLEIACPMLEEIEFLGRLAIEDTKPVNLNSLISVTLDFEYSEGNHRIKEIILQLRHAKELKFGRKFMKTLLPSKGKKEDDLSTLSLSNKCLVLDCPDSDGIALALCNLYVLEKLVINLSWGQCQENENFWSSKLHLFNCLANNLKIVQISVMSGIGNKRKGVVNFIKFLLKNAQVLEKMTVIIEDQGSNFVSQSFGKISRIRRCSQHTKVELLFKQRQGMLSMELKYQGSQILSITCQGRSRVVMQEEARDAIFGAQISLALLWRNGCSNTIKLI